MRSKKLIFNYANLNRIPTDEHGIYFFWCHDFCIYIGKAHRSTLKERLTSHYNSSHNDDLNLWIQSSHQLQFQYEIVKNSISIPAKERNRIKQFAPLTNKQLIKKRI